MRFRRVSFDSDTSGEVGRVLVQAFRLLALRFVWLLECGARICLDCYIYLSTLFQSDTTALFVRHRVVNANFSVQIVCLFDGDLGLLTLAWMGGPNNLLDDSVQLLSSPYHLLWILAPPHRVDHTRRASLSRRHCLRGVLWVWVALLLPWIVIAPLSGMAFDAGYAVDAYTYIWCVLTYPISVLIAGFLRKKRAVLALLPCANFLAVEACSSACASPLAESPSRMLA